MFKRAFSKLFKRRQPELDLSQTQREALIDAMVFAMMADGEMAEEEREELNRSLDEIEWSGEKNRELFISESIERVEHATSSGQAAREYIGGISERLERDELREHAYAIASRIVCSDHDVAEAERGLMSLFIQQFHLDPERAMELSEDAHRDFDLL